MEWFASGMILGLFFYIFVDRRLFVDWMIIRRSNGTFSLKKFTKFPRKSQWKDNGGIIRDNMKGPFYSKGAVRAVFYRNNETSPESLDGKNDWSEAGEAVSKMESGKAYRDLIGSAELPYGIILIMIIFTVLVGVIGYMAGHGGV